MKNKTTAAILALILGGIGVHRFYLGQAGLGLVYLLFCWTFIPAFVALVDFLVFLLMDDEKFNNKYNNGKSPMAPANVNVSDELEKLHGLKEKGVITAEEFEARKAKLLR